MVMTQVSWICGALSDPLATMVNWHGGLILIIFPPPVSLALLIFSDFVTIVDLIVVAVAVAIFIIRNNNIFVELPRIGCTCSTVALPMIHVDIDVGTYRLRPKFNIYRAEGLERTGVYC